MCRPMASSAVNDAEVMPSGRRSRSRTKDGKGWPLVRAITSPAAEYRIERNRRSPTNNTNHSAAAMKNHV